MKERQVRLLVFGLRGDVAGGIESFVLTMQRFMPKDVVFDYVLLDHQTLMFRSEIEARGGRCYFIPYYGRHPFRSLLSLLRLLRERRQDIQGVYVNLFSMVHILPVVVARILGYRVLLHAHTNNLPKRSIVYRMLNAMGRWLCAGIDGLRLSCSEDSAAFLFGTRRMKETKIIYNAIDVEQFGYDEAVRSQVRQSLGIQDEFVVGFVGRLAYEKNPLFLIDVFACFHQLLPNSRLLIVGEGGMRGQMEALTREKGLVEAVSFLGRRDDIGRLYLAMDAFLLPSRFEGLGIVLVEAQAAGLPCLTTLETVPRLVSVTDLLMRAGSEETALAWAVRLKKMACSSCPSSRKDYVTQVAASPFNIRIEAVRFSNIIREYVSS